LNLVLVVVLVLEQKPTTTTSTRTNICIGMFVIPAKAGIVRLKAHLVREVEVLFRYALSGL